MHSLKMFSALAAVAVLALPAAVAAQDITPLKVEGRAPTEIRIALHGKSVVEVRQAIQVAAHTVCRNAVSNRELGIDEADWCTDTATGRALRQYAKIVRYNAALADAGTDIVLAAR